MRNAHAHPPVSYTHLQQLRTTRLSDIPLRVTFYARVSTDSDEQLNSLDNQIGYYRDYITRNQMCIRDRVRPGTVVSETVTLPMLPFVVPESLIVALASTLSASTR